MSYASTILATPNLFAYWRMGDGAGPTLVDQLGNANATAVNGPTFGQAGALAGDADTAVLFNGTSQSATVPGNNGTFAGHAFLLVATAGYSLEAWIKTTSAKNTSFYGGTPANPAIGDKFGGAFGFGVHGGKLRFVIWDNVAFRTLDSAASLNDGGWHHVVATQLNLDLAIYLDGAPAGTLHALGSLYGGGYTAGALATGYDGAHDFLAGSLDECAIYDRALTSAEVLAHYQAGISAGVPLGRVARVQVLQQANSRAVVSISSSRAKVSISNSKVTVL